MACLIDNLPETFPVEALLPKKEIGVERFLQRYPESDGRGTVIAIFDSGVDPAASGLQVTSDGKRKIIDLIDCSGNGDVTMTIQQKSEDGCLKGATGRILKVPDEWNNPSGVYRVGVKNVFALFPDRLEDRMREKRKEKLWDKKHAESLAKARKELSSFESAHPDPITNTEVQLKHESLKSAIDALIEVDKKYHEAGPSYDCVLFHDGNQWRACIDTSECGDLKSCKLIGVYKETGDYAQFSSEDMFTYSINVYQEGEILSIVTSCSSHGTHVASIAAANFPNENELSGIAPGAQVISMQIGSIRLGSMETGVSFMRAIKAAVDNKVDLINISYGEAAKWPNAGQIIRHLNELSQCHGITVISSAGNNGPALTTVGSPGGTSDGVIGIAALVTPEMMAAEYSLREKNPTLQYTWSSRGPCTNGALGVSITAPGGAIASVPNWTLRANQLMNGTSMSSPNACGGLAVLLSALKQKKISYSPTSLRMVIENSALKVPNSCHFDQGHGLLQVDSAFEAFVAEKRSWIHNVKFKIDCGAGNRGIYIRNSITSKNDHRYTVTVTPIYPDCADSQSKLDLNAKFALVSTASWIEAPKFLAMSNISRSFHLSICTDSLKDHSYYYEEVQVYDLSCPGCGPVFRVPITVVQPQIVPSDGVVDIGSVPMKSGQIQRWFFVVPLGATWADISIQGADDDPDCRYICHTIQLIKERSFSDHEFRSMFNVKANVKTQKVFPVMESKVIEVCIAKWWAAAGSTTLSVKLEFHSLCADQKSIVVNGSKGFQLVSLHSRFKQEEVLPVASLTHHVIPIVPKEHCIRLLDERDILLDGKHLNELMLTYSFSMTKPCELTPYVPLFSDLLYESDFDSQAWMLFDSNKQLIKCGDAFPFKNNYTAKLSKGDYTLKFQLRHHDTLKLESFKDLTVNLYVKLASPISLDVYSQRRNVTMHNGKGKFTSRQLIPGNTCLAYIGMPSDEKIPKTAKMGHYFAGHVTYSTNDDVKKVVKSNLQWFVPPTKPTETKNSIAKKTQPVKPPAVEYKDALRDFMTGWMCKLDGCDDELKAIVNQYPNDIIILNAQLNALESAKTVPKAHKEIVSLAAHIISLIDAKALSEFYGVKQVVGSPEALQKSEQDKKKSILINALTKKGISLSELILKQEKSNVEETNDDSSDLKEDLRETFRNLLKWVDASDSKASSLAMHHGLALGLRGTALKTALKSNEDSIPSREIDDILIKICDAMGLEHVEEYFKNCNIVKYPTCQEKF